MVVLSVGTWLIIRNASRFRGWVQVLWVYRALRYILVVLERQGGPSGQRVLKGHSPVKCGAL